MVSDAVAAGKPVGLVQVHAEARGFTLDRQKTAAAGVPWHPAAEAFWKSQGAQLA